MPGPDRIFAIDLIDEAVAAGARRQTAGIEAGIGERTYWRWVSSHPNTPNPAHGPVRPLPDGRDVTGQAPTTGDDGPAGEAMTIAAGGQATSVAVVSAADSRSTTSDYQPAPSGQATSPDAAEPAITPTAGGSGCTVAPLRPEHRQSTPDSVPPVSAVEVSSQTPDAHGAVSDETGSATNPPEHTDAGVTGSVPAVSGVGAQGRVVRADRRQYAIRPRPAHALSEDERHTLLAVANSPEFASKPPGQIVPIPADQGIYLASESTFYRVLKAAGQIAHRGSKRARQPMPRVRTHTATGPSQVWTWDITWLPAAIAGSFYKLFMVIDVYSPKIVAWEVHTTETADLASELIRKACFRENITAPGLVQHVR